MWALVGWGLGGAGLDAGFGVPAGTARNLLTCKGFHGCRAAHWCFTPRAAPVGWLPIGGDPVGSVDAGVIRWRCWVLR